MCQCWTPELISCPAHTQMSSFQINQFNCSSSVVSHNISHHKLPWLLSSSGGPVEDPLENAELQKAAGHVLMQSERKCSFSTLLRCSKDKLAQVTKEFSTFLDIFQAYQKSKKKKKKGQDLISFKGKPQLKFEDVIIIYFLNEAIFVWKEHPVPGSLTFSASDFHRSLQQRLNVSKTHPQHAALLLEMGFHGLGSSRPCIGIIESCQPSPTNGRAARPVSIKKDMKVSQKAKSYKLS